MSFSHSYITGFFVPLLVYVFLEVFNWSQVWEPNFLSLFQQALSVWKTSHGRNAALQTAFPEFVYCMLWGKCNFRTSFFFDQFQKYLQNKISRYK